MAKMAGCGVEDEVEGDVTTGGEAGPDREGEAAQARRWESNGPLVVTGFGGSLEVGIHRPRLLVGLSGTRCAESCGSGVSPGLCSTFSFEQADDACP
jgi:hypothetical protein